MGKLEFLQKLSEKLSEELPRGVVLSNLRYYESYIDGEVAKGKSVESVMDELGDPYMIARTIIDGLESDGFANQNYADETVYAETIRPEAETVYEKSENGQSEASYTTYSEPTYEKTETYEESEKSKKNHRTVTVSDHGCLIAAILLILIVVVVTVVVGKVIRFIWPVLAPVLLVVLICSIIKDKNR